MLFALFQKKKLQEIMTNPRDQFGLHLLFHGQYSQNKNKRWLIPDTIKENISLMQARQTMN
jgi:hypothetical protein